MQLLYLDHSGEPDDVAQKHVVLAGLSVFERQTFWLSQEVDKIAARFNPGDPAAVEIHASPMTSGRGIWRKFPKADRLQALVDCCEIIRRSRDSTALIGGVIEKSALQKIPGSSDIISYAFEQVCLLFDSQLKYLHKIGKTQRGVIIFDQASYEQTIQNLATDFRTFGTSWGVIHNLSEVPLFIDSRASRLVQLADVVAYALFRHFEKNDSTLYEILERRFDRQGQSSRGLFTLLDAGGEFRLTP
jgi:hypothetical protein